MARLFMVDFSGLLVFSKSQLIMMNNLTKEAQFPFRYTAARQAGLFWNRQSGRDLTLQKIVQRNQVHFLNSLIIRHSTRAVINYLAFEPLRAN